jgi:prepilin-type N-terminal cleavage/methylation domain-containing protein
MRPLTCSHDPRKSGFSLIETIISTMILSLLFGALSQSVANLRQVTMFSSERASLQTMGDEALMEMVDELRNSGEQEMGGLDYPYVFDGGVPDPAYFAHEHEPADGLAVDGDTDFGVDREIVFLLPADADNDGRPDVDAAGELSWGAEEVSYTVTTRADGINYLERRDDGAAPSIVGHHVERMVIDTSTSSGFEIPLETVRIRLFFRMIGSNGDLIRYSNEAVVALRNGQE